MKYFILFLCIVLHGAAFAQTRKDSSSWNGQPGGKYLPSTGALRTLIVFAEFPDDSLDPGNAEWPKGIPPRRMAGWVDSAWSDIPTPWSLTDYFGQMSLGTFRLTGITRHVITPKTRSAYRALRKTRKDIHRDIIEQLDSTINFAEFDNWTLTGEYNHKEQPDGIVDLIIIIWRNIDDDIDAAAQKPPGMRSSFGFIGDEADLGFGMPVLVDEGRRMVKMSYGIEHTTGNTETAGSGVTLSKAYTHVAHESMLQTTIHEIGHYLMGGMEYHTGFGCWGMVSTYGIRMFVPNSFERYRLGWIKLITLSGDTATLRDIPLPDYVTTGVAVRFIIDSMTGQYFYLENHQGISRWDRTMYLDSIERGIYVLRQDRATDSASGPGHQLRLVPADGLHRWDVSRMEPHSCCGSVLLPVFRQGVADRDSGFHDCDHVPYTNPSTGKKQVAEIILEENEKGETVHANRKGGDGKDAFRQGYATVFSPWSNPGSQDKHRQPTGFGFEIIGADTNNGSIVYRLSLFSHTAAGATPGIVQNVTAKKKGQTAIITWQANAEPDIVSYKIYKTNQQQKANTAPTFLAKVNHKKDTTMLSWTDRKTPTGARYTVTAVDRQGRESLYSIRTSALQQLQK